MSEKRLILFDWNGTLQDDVPLYYEYSVRRALARYGLPSPSLEEYRAEMSAAEFMEFFWRRGVPMTVTTDDIFTASRREILADGKSANLFPEARRVLESLRVSGVTQTLVSMAPSGEIIELLDEHRIGWEFAIISGDVHVKAEMFRAHCAMLDVAPERALVVGDLVDDARAAVAAGITPILCPRGYHPRERMEAARAEIPNLQIVDTLDGVFDYL